MRPVSLGGHPCLARVPEAATSLFLMCHGAGAGMRHRFLADVASALAARSIATARWELPYMAAGRARPDPPAVCEAAVREVCAAAAARWPALRRIAGGKSFGGRMTSSAAANAELDLGGLAFLGFPLHPARAPSTTRAEHLARVDLPMLFLQGTRDDLADLALFRPIVRRLGARATLVEIDAAGHGFDVLVRSGRTAPEVVDELAGAIARWIETLPR